MTDREGTDGVIPFVRFSEPKNKIILPLDRKLGASIKKIDDLFFFLLVKKFRHKIYVLCV